MSTFIMLTRVSADAVGTPRELTGLEQTVMKHVRSECPEVKWVHSYATFGPYDYVDIFTAPDTETATKVSALVRTYGHAHSEIWPATGWDEYKKMIGGLPHAA